MHLDSQIRDGVRSMIDAVAVPEAPVHQILAPRRHQLKRRTVSQLVPLGLAACLAFAVIVVPKTSSAFVQSVAARVAAILHWTPPVQAPRSLVARMQVHDVGFDRARAMVAFHLVAPSGMPSDAKLASVLVVPTARYATRTKKWSLSQNAVLFTYKRRDGRSFHLMAAAYDGAQPYPKYMFVETGTKPDGMPALKRFEQFAWRNGDQSIGAMDDGITPAEIARIREAMHGTPLVSEWPLKHRKASTMYLLSKP